MPTQDRFDKEVNAVAHNCERDSVFSAVTVQRQNALVDRKISGKFDERVSIRLDEFDLTRETLLTRDLAPHPSCLPFSPLGKGEGFKHGIGGIKAGDRSVEIAVDLRRSDIQTSSSVNWSLCLVIIHGTPFVIDLTFTSYLRPRFQDSNTERLNPRPGKSAKIITSPCGLINNHRTHPCFVRTVARTL